MHADTSDASKANSKEILDSMDKPFYGDEDQNKSSMSFRGGPSVPRILVEVIRLLTRVSCPETEPFCLLSWTSTLTLISSIENPNQVAGGLKAAINNPQITDEGKKAAQDKLDNM